MEATEEVRTWHRKFAIQAFNDAWTLIEKADRTPAEDDALLNTAHASRYHWGVVGTPKNISIGEWQISHVYTLLNRAEPALYHAQRCLDVCLENGIGDFPLAYAYEALCRASATAGDKAASERFREEALRAADGIAETEEREKLLQDLATVPIIA